jgi:hypothetical protein
MTKPAASSASTRRTTLIRASVVVAVWFLVGFVRAPRIAADWLAASEAHAGLLATGVSVDFVAPIPPPVWLVNVSGDVTEPGDAAPVYRSHRLVLVEPITGIVLEFAQG